MPSWDGCPVNAQQGNLVFDYLCSLRQKGQPMESVCTESVAGSTV